MYQSTVLIPDGEVPRAYQGGTEADIPVVELGAHAQLQFQDDETALSYLAALIEQCTLLVDRIQRRQETQAEDVSDVARIPNPVAAVPEFASIGEDGSIVFPDAVQLSRWLRSNHASVAEHDDAWQRLRHLLTEWEHGEYSATDVEPGIAYCSRELRRVLIGGD